MKVFLRGDFAFIIRFTAIGFIRNFVRLQFIRGSLCVFSIGRGEIGGVDDVINVSTAVVAGGVVLGENPSGVDDEFVLVEAFGQILKNKYEKKGD